MAREETAETIAIDQTVTCLLLGMSVAPWPTSGGPAGYWGPPPAALGEAIALLKGCGLPTSNKKGK